LIPYAKELDIRVNWNPDLRLGEPLTKVFDRVIRYDVGVGYSEKGSRIANLEIIDCVRESRPKYVIWPTMNYEIEGETFQEIRRLGAWVIGWFFDDECRFEDYSRWWLPYMDYIFTCDRNSVARYRELGAKALHLLVTADPEFFRPAPSSRTCDVSFIGSRAVGDRENLVAQLAKDGIHVSTFGRGWDAGYMPIEEIPQVYSNSKINLCFTKSYGQGTRHQLKDKIFDITMCGGFLLCEYCEGIEDYFELEKEIVCFRNASEASEKIRYYLGNESERSQIARAGLLRSTHDYPQQKLLENAFRALEIISDPGSPRHLTISERRIPSEKDLRLKEEYHNRWAEALKAAGFEEQRYREEHALALSYRQMQMDLADNSKKILLVQLKYPSSPFPGPNLPVGLGYIGEQLELNGFPYEVIDLSIESQSNLFSSIERFDPEYVGVSMMSLDLICHYRLLEEIKSRFPNVKIIVGGPHISFARENALLDCAAIDYGVVHEGEKTLLELLHGLPLSSIKGLLHRGTDGKILYTGDREYITDLDALPFPRYRKFDLRRYGSTISIASSRGCPFSCIFCGAFISMGRKWRARSAEGILSEMEHWCRNGVYSFNFIDSNFFLSKKRVKQLCSALSWKQLKVTLSSDGMRAKDADLDLLHQLKKFGLQSVAIGVESANDDILRFIKKAETVADLNLCFQTLLKLDIDVVAFFIIGLPGETLQHVYNSFAFALSYPNIREAFFFNPNPLPGTELYTHATQHRMLRGSASQILENIGGMGKQILIETEQLSVQDRSELQEMARQVSRLIELRHRLYRQGAVVSAPERERIDEEMRSIQETLKDSTARLRAGPRHVSQARCKTSEIPTHLTSEEMNRLEALAMQAAGNTYVEVGSYVGASACCIASGIQSSGKAANLFCVDTWRNDAMSEGPKDTFDEFMANTKNFSHVITPLRGWSTEVAKKFDRSIDFLFIDGGHSYEEVCQDVAAWFPKLSPGARVIFHDIEWSEGVQRVVAETVRPIAKTEGGLPNMYWAEVFPVQLSVIIPTLNRSRYLQKLLGSLSVQTFPGHLFEVIVVDNGSTDDTAEVCRSFRNRLPKLRHILDPRPGLHVGRHAGYFASQGEILVFADDDIEACPSWLEGIVESFRDPSVALASGKILPKFEITPPRWFGDLCHKTESGWSLGWFSLMDFGNVARELPHDLVWGCNFAIRKRTLSEVGGFHPDAFPKDLIKYRGDGEIAVALAVRDKGLKAYYNPFATVFHWVSKERLTPEYVYHRAFIQGISDSYSRIRTSRTLSSERPTPTSRRTIHDVVERGLADGFNYHQRLVQADARLMEWVLRDSYLGHEEIPQ
jgi:radical SAM superfamily enzyme YgiQ (UPF0313 family)/glycosyltransferase involved in cell wall biosynthesis/predicted O-methyltransferase YrrM